MAKRHRHPPTKPCWTASGRLPSAQQTEASFDTWISARSHLAVLAQNSTEDELIVYAAAKNFFVDTAIVPRADLKHVDQTDLLQWSSHPGPVVGYSTSLDDGPFTIARGTSFHGSKLLELLPACSIPRVCRVEDGRLLLYGGLAGIPAPVGMPLASRTRRLLSL